MKKIRYLIVVIPILAIMLFAQSNVHGFDFINWEPEDGDMFNVVYYDNTSKTSYLGLITEYRDSSVIYMTGFNYYADTFENFEVGDYLYWHEGLGGFLNVSPPLSQGDMVSFVSSGELSMGIKTITVFHDDSQRYYLFNAENLPIRMPSYAINENGLPTVEDFNYDWYLYAYNKGKQEMQEYYESIIPNIEYDKYWEGHGVGYLEGMYDNMGDVPTWVLNGNLKLNDELYNYIDYDNLIFYENVGQITFDGSEAWYEYSIAHQQGYFAASVEHDYSNSNDIFISNSGFYITNSYDIFGDYVGKAIRYRKDLERIYVKLPVNSIDEFKQYLSQNPLRIIYELDEKQEIPILQEDINQLPFYEYGISQGYINGYQKGQADSKAIQGFIPTIIGAIWVVIANFMAFEIFGLSLWWILGIVVSISLAIFLLKLVMRN